MDSPASQKHIVHAAATVSCLEGRARLQFRGVDIESSTLSGINKRVKILEAHYNITSPPPSLDPTWDSLAWRICRLDYQGTKLRHYAPVNLALNLLPDGTEVSIEALQTICSELESNVSFGAYNHDQWPKCVEDEEILDIIRQRMFFTAGRNSTDIQIMPDSRVHIYAALVALTMKLENLTPPPRTGRPPPNIIPNFPTPFTSKKKDCCGCCLCHCHKDSESNSGSDSDSGSESGSDASSILPPKRKRSFGFGWVRKVFCLRPKVDDDAASIRTRSSVTVV